MNYKEKELEAKRYYDIRNFMDGLKGFRSLRGQCPFHDDRSPSFSVYWHDGTQYWKCHTCDIGGDIIDFIGYLKVGGYSSHVFKLRKQALEILLNETFVVEKHYEVPEEPKLSLSALYQYFPMSGYIRRYCYSRGIDDSMIGKYMLGGIIDLIIPSFLFGNLMGIKIRLPNGTKPKYLSEPGSKTSLFNHDEVYHAQEPVFLCKGEIAAMIVQNRTGVLSCAQTTGEGAKLSTITKIALAFSKVIVIGDNDIVGTKCAKERAETLQCEVWFPPSKYKDVDEYILQEEEMAAKVLKSLWY